MYLFVWGVPGVVASVTSQLLLGTSHAPQIGLVWALYVVVGAAASLILGRREQELTRVLTFAGRVLSATWIAIGVTLALLVCTSVFVPGALPPRFLPGVIAFLLAIGLYVMGVLLEFRGLYAAATLWWAGGLVMVFWPNEAYVVHAALLVVGYLLPAEMLRRQLTDDDALD